MLSLMANGEVGGAFAVVAADLPVGLRRFFGRLDFRALSTAYKVRLVSHHHVCPDSPQTITYSPPPIHSKVFFPRHSDATLTTKVFHTRAAMAPPRDLTRVDEGDEFGDALERRGDCDEDKDYDSDCFDTDEVCASNEEATAKEVTVEEFTDECLTSFEGAPEKTREEFQKETKKMFAKAGIGSFRQLFRPKLPQYRDFLYDPFIRESVGSDLKAIEELYVSSCLSTVLRFMIVCILKETPAQVI